MRDSGSVVWSVSDVDIRGSASVARMVRMLVVLSKSGMSIGVSRWLNMLVTLHSSSAAKATCLATVACNSGIVILVMSA